ncbi:MAG: hypothetical protein PHR35_21850 [Kiritimatiellae bacterium]|nr:hypothetical protein [Kiritimatiellia bacterium]
MSQPKQSIPEGADGTTDDPGELHFAHLVSGYAPFGLGEQAARIDRTLVLIGQMLNISQPPRPGKMGIRWWITKGERHPVVVEWRLTKTRGHLWPARVDPSRMGLRAKENGTFAVCRMETTELLQMAQKLLAMRKSLRDGVARIRHTINGLRLAQEPVLNFQSRRLTAIDSAIHGRMVEHGYYQVEGDSTG